MKLNILLILVRLVSLNIVILISKYIFIILKFFIHFYLSHNMLLIIFIYKYIYFITFRLNLWLNRLNLWTSTLFGSMPSPIFRTLLRILEYAPLWETQFGVMAISIILNARWTYIRGEIIRNAKYTIEKH